MHTQRNIVTAVFEDQARAREAIHALKAAGFDEAQIGLTSRDRDGVHVAQERAEHVGESYASEGALSGVAAGVGIGALWGLGILAGALPAIGPAIAGGTLAIMLSSAAAGAAAAGVTGALVGLGIPKEDAEYYESEVIAGKTVVTIDAGERESDARAIVEGYGGRDRASNVAASMQQVDHGPAPIAPPPADATPSAHPQHLHFESNLPISPMEAKESLAGFGTHPTPRPVTEPTTDHVTFEIPVELAHLEGQTTSAEAVNEEANMPPVSELEMPIREAEQEEHLGVEKLPQR
jgi:hypothetical protein